MEKQKEDIVADKSAEKLRKSLNSSLLKFSENEEKISFLINCIVDYDEKGTVLKSENSTLKRENGKIVLFEKKVASLEKQLSKAEMAKAKLEDLCRELNKSIKEEKELNQLKLKNLQTTHNETVEALKKSLGEIQQNVESKQDHAKRVAEVEKLSVHLNELAGDYDKRLKDLKKLYEAREADMSNLAKAKEEEMLVLKSQVDEMKKRVLEIFEENVKIKQQLLTSEERVQKSVESELSLQKTLDEYSSKYSKLLKSFSHSNKSFDKVKDDMTRMNGNLIRVESDAHKHRLKVEQLSKDIDVLNAEKAGLQEELAHKDRQLSQLQELCRRLRTSNDSNSCENDLPNSTILNETNLGNKDS